MPGRKGLLNRLGPAAVRASYSDLVRPTRVDADARSGGRITAGREADTTIGARVCCQRIARRELGAGGSPIIEPAEATAVGHRGAHTGADAQAAGRLARTEIGRIAGCAVADDNGLEFCKSRRTHIKDCRCRPHDRGADSDSLERRPPGQPVRASLVPVFHGAPFRSDDGQRWHTPCEFQGETRKSLRGLRAPGIRRPHEFSYRLHRFSLATPSLGSGGCHPSPETSLSMALTASWRLPEIILKPRDP